MEKYQKIYARQDRSIRIEVIPGHFATNHSHVNFYVDMTRLKASQRMAKAAAAILAGGFHSATPVDTIICLEGTEIVAAFLAEALSQSAPMNVSSGNEINVLTPQVNTNNQMIFQDNTQKMVTGKNVLLMIATASTGKTLDRSINCLDYYNGNLVGIAALFSAAHEVRGTKIVSLFDANDLSGYQSFIPGQCVMCTSKQKIDAIVNSFGYTLL